jgi:hypothetical protein
MGLLTDTYSDILKKLQGIDNRADDDFSEMDSDFNTSGSGIKASLTDRPGGSPLTQPGGNLFPTSIVPQNKTKTIPKEDTSVSVASVNTSELGKDNNFLSKLSNLVGVDPTKVAATWKDKGGFDGLMANPAFTMGLAFLQAGANGKTLGQGVLDNVLKAGVISEQYKKKLADKTEVLSVSEADMNQIKSVLKTKGIDKPGWWRKMFPGNQSEQYEQAVEDVAFKVQEKVNAKLEAAKAAGKKIKVGTRLYKETIEEMIKSGEIGKAGGLNIAGYQVIDSTLEAREHGGPVHTGKAYVVGEAGPEIMIPKSSGNVVDNDDSQVFAMLLASNPQLQKVSKERAMKILKAKFPEYFD